MRSFVESAVVGAGVTLASGAGISVVVLLWVTAALFLKEVF